MLNNNQRIKDNSKNYASNFIIFVEKFSDRFDHVLKEKNKLFIVYS